MSISTEPERDMPRKKRSLFKESLKILGVQVAVVGGVGVVVQRMGRRRVTCTAQEGGAAMRRGQQKER